MKTYKPVAIAMQMLQTGLDFIVEHTDIKDIQQYKEDYNITILDKDSSLGKWQARVIYSDKHTEIINIYEYDE